MSSLGRHLLVVKFIPRDEVSLFWEQHFFEKVGFRGRPIIGEEVYIPRG